MLKHIARKVVLLQKPPKDKPRGGLALYAYGKLCQSRNLFYLASGLLRGKHLLHYFLYIKSDIHSYVPLKKVDILMSFYIIAANSFALNCLPDVLNPKRLGLLSRGTLRLFVT